MGYITLSREALIHNLDIIAQHVGTKDKIAVVLKDNAYGHGSVMIAEVVADYGIKQAVVRTEQEAIEIEPFFENILILADFPTSNSKSSFSYAINTSASIERFPKGTRVELKVDTGMHRNGIEPLELSEAFVKMAHQGLECIGVMSHQRSADALSSEWFWQRQKFDILRKEAISLASNYGWNLRFHLSNSAGTFRQMSCGDDMVRVGIALYGCLEMEAPLMQPDLKPVLSLWGEKMVTRVLKRGERIGYNGIYEASVDEVVSTYDVGYANGMNRLASNTFVSPEGYPIRGRISMDSTVFATDVNPLLIFDNANTYAASVGTIGYEIMTGLDKNLKRSWSR